MRIDLYRKGRRLVGDCAPKKWYVTLRIFIQYQFRIYLLNEVAYEVFQER